MQTTREKKYIKQVIRPNLKKPPNGSLPAMATFRDGPPMGLQPSFARATRLFERDPPAAAL